MRIFNPIVTSFAVCLLLMNIGPTGSCNNKETMLSKDKLATGVWGGQHVRLEVTEKGGIAEFDCAHSTVDEPIVLDANGNFVVKGKFTSERSGPVTREDVDNSLPVIYSGAVSDDQLTLSITSVDKKTDLGNYTLTRGSEGRLMKCR